MTDPIADMVRGASDLDVLRRELVDLKRATLEDQCARDHEPAGRWPAIQRLARAVDAAVERARSPGAD